MPYPNNDENSNFSVQSHGSVHLSLTPVRRNFDNLDNDRQNSNTLDPIAFQGFPMNEDPSSEGFATAGNGRVHLQQPLPSGLSTHPPVFMPPQELTYLWGTGISLEEFKHDFRTFLDVFRHTHEFEDSLRRATANDMREIELDMSILKKINDKLYNEICSSPAECLRMMASVLEDLFVGAGGAILNPDGISIAPRNMPQAASLTELGPENIETLIAIRGLVIRTGKVIPEVRVAHFECWICKNVERSAVERGRITEPVTCSHCSGQYSFQLIHNMCLFEDKQLIRVQEAPENLADGETPVTISVVVYGDLVDAVVPGDRVIMTGIYRASPLKLNVNTRVVKSVFKTHLDAAHIEKSSRSTNFVASGGNDFDFTDTKKVAELRVLSERPDIYPLLIKSLAPTIWGHDDVKMGILCQLFGGSHKNFRHGRFRSDINIILCGDPGVAKSQLLTQVHAISPRGVYTSGKGSSSVGLTAFVVRDADTGEFVLEPGALVLSDRGICCIDEFDKMGEDTRSILHEVMEQQTLSIAKAGIIAQLNARTSILAAANPKESQWNLNLNIVENLQIEPTLLSRFDLIYILLDKRDEVNDRNLAAHVLSLYTEKEGEIIEKQMRQKRNNNESTYDRRRTDNEDSGSNSSRRGEYNHLEIKGIDRSHLIDSHLLSRYIAYAKEHINPKLTQETCDMLSKSYCELRRAGGHGKTVTATLRELESMVRLSEARAKMRFASYVTPEDVDEAKNLIQTALKQSATDPRTGMINLEMFNAPDMTSHSTEGYLRRLERIIELRFQGRESCTINELRQALLDQERDSTGRMRKLTPQQFMDVLALMAEGSHISSYTNSTVKFVKGGAAAGGGGGV